ncbi:MAG TPA: hypothetical protein VF599_01625, partial [Pyrinomonadaceae bacterium]
IFELAVERLGLNAGLDECLFITENAGHTDEARRLGIKTLLFGETDAEDGFDDWSEAPLLIAQMVSPESPNNLEGALRLRLAVEHDLELLFVSEKSEDGIIHGQVNKSLPLPVAESESRQSSVVTIPVNVEIEMNNQGRILAVNSEEPDKETLDEAAHYIKTLDENKQISRRKGPLAQGETHRETVNEKGEKRIKRERFSAF